MALKRIGDPPCSGVDLPNPRPPPRRLPPSVRRPGSHTGVHRGGGQSAAPHGQLPPAGASSMNVDPHQRVAQCPPGRRRHGRACHLHRGCDRQRGRRTRGRPLAQARAGTRGTRRSARGVRRRRDRRREPARRPRCRGASEGGSEVGSRGWLPIGKWVTDPRGMQPRGQGRCQRARRDSNPQPSDP